MSPRPTLCLGFGGYAESGKDACAEILERWGWHRTMMSEPLLEAVLTLDPWIYVTREELTDLGLYPEFTDNWWRYHELYVRVGYDRSKRVQDVRTTFQKLGTDVGRRFWGEDCWGDIVFATVRGAQLTGQHIVVTGIRYPSDLAQVSEVGGVSVWVERATPDGIGGAPVNEHSSDNTLQAGDFDVILHNRGTLAELCTAVYGLVRDLAGEHGVEPASVGPGGESVDG